MSCFGWATTGSGTVGDMGNPSFDRSRARPEEGEVLSGSPERTAPPRCLARTPGPFASPSGDQRGHLAIGREAAERELAEDLLALDADFEGASLRGHEVD